MHGIKRNPVWTFLKESAEKGTKEIKVTGYVDWQPSEYIVIATTELESFRTETAETHKADNGSDYR